ncbi:class I SAM-dependent methyltransferase [Kitasatospora sp. A2-31]|uniref:class I SAM-dependent methyltransferase n=1 Tax=Kitasatospora sp. A2-31 TaxID=2916414 RepID=UPI001EE9C6B1|nr:class I SAM-dependent methyltransferase [Kitasatospora sp. A2-31]MCG6495418.1 class I SAM-dependent methyltransferase [Kitasatospora sp. A2-31]
MSVREPDPAKQEEFAGRTVQVLNDACLGFMTSVGHQTGLFDTMAGLEPSTSTEIADAAGLNERYVREWLGGMVVGGFVEYDPDGARYRLPPEHAASLTRAAGPENMAGLMQYLALMGEVEQQIVEAFRKGGGLPYSAYPRFQALQAEESARVYDLALVDGIVPLVPGLADRLRAGIDALDIGTGEGHAVNILARAFPASRFTGVDISEKGIGAAKAEAARRGIDNARFEVVDSAELTGAYDLVTAFDVIHDLARPAETLAAVARALRPDGVFLMGDIAASSRLEENVDHPLGPALYAFSTFYCMTVSLGEGGAGLGTVWGEQTARRMLAEAGFGSVDVKQVEGDVLNLYYLARPNGSAA